MKSGAYRKKHLEDESTTSISPAESRTRYKEESLIVNRRQKEEPIEDERIEVIKMFERMYAPSKVLFREKEFEIVAEFVRKATEGKVKSRCLIATGMPGAGKTLICSRALASIEKAKVVITNAGTSKTIKSLLQTIEP